MKEGSNKPVSPSKLALWRYGVISSLLHRSPDGLSLQEMLEQIAQQQYLDPHGRSRSLSPETIRKWLSRYRIGGLPLLETKERSDSGSSSIPKVLEERLISLRDQHPRWKLSILFNELRKDNSWNGHTPSIAALYRFCKAKGLERKGEFQQIRRSFEFSDFGDLWIADYLHGPKIKINGQKRKTYIHAIIDDATRFIVAADVFLNENTEVLISELKRSVRCFGIPCRFYSDNGSSYRSRHLQIVGARLGINMPKTPPYVPEGRGKVERWFRTLRDQFLETTDAKTIDQLRSQLQEWIAKYHQTNHRALECSPMQKRAKVSTNCRVLPEAIPIDSLFMMEKRCRVYNDSTIKFRRRSYEVPGCQPGTRVLIFYNPDKPDQIYFGDEFQPARPLNKTANSRRFYSPPTRKDKNNEE